MVGGNVLQIDSAGPAEVKLWVCNPKEGEGCVHVDPASGARLPRLGEEVWWQAGRVYFDGDRVSLRKVGYSHLPDDCRCAVSDKQR